MCLYKLMIINSDLNLFGMRIRKSLSTYYIFKIKKNTDFALFMKFYHFKFM